MRHSRLEISPRQAARLNRTASNIRADTNDGTYPKIIHQDLPLKPTVPSDNRACCAREWAALRQIMKNADRGVQRVTTSRAESLFFPAARPRRGRTVSDR